MREHGHVDAGQAPLAQALLLGVKAAVTAIVIHALMRVARRALKGAGDCLIAGLAFVSLFLLNLPFPLIIAGAALWGWIRARGAVATGLPATAPPLDDTLRTAGIWGAIWLVPLAGLMLFEQGILARIGSFFAMPVPQNRMVGPPNFTESSN
jgi:chromate transporter